MVSKRHGPIMDDYTVGYKKPPLHSRFQPGNRANPNGRRKRKTQSEVEIFKSVLNGQIFFRERGKLKRAPRIELMIMSLGAAARKGDVGAADMLLKLRAHCEKHGDINREKLVLVLRGSDADA